MKRLGFALAMLAVVAAAAWAYNVNYQTKMARARVERLHARIAAEREALEVLRVEWAYLNAPDRLARLVAQNNDRLELVPMGPQHFGEVAAIPFPPNPPPNPPPQPEAEPEGAPPALVEVTPEAEAGTTGQTAPEPPLVVSERTAAVDGVPLPAPRPAPRPASWRAQ